GIGGAPERRGANLVDAREIEAVAGIPDLLAEPRVRIGAFVEQRRDEVEIAHRLIEMRARLRVKRLGRPLAVERAVERGGAVVGGDVRIGAASHTGPRGGAT